jgi:ribosomal protein L32
MRNRMSKWKRGRRRSNDAKKGLAMVDVSSN